MAASDKEAIRKRTFYHNQRLNAEETGNQGEVDKIYGKLGKKAPQVGGSDRVDKAVLSAPFMAINPAMGAEGAAGGLLAHIGGTVLEKLFPGAAEKIAGLGAGGAEKALASGGKGFPEALAPGARGAQRMKTLPRARTATETKPIVSRPQKALPRAKDDVAPKNVTPKPRTRKAASKKVAAPKKTSAAKPKAKKAPARR